MPHIYSLSEVNLQQASIVTIGVFDGVHRGHQHLIQRLVAQARATGRLAVVLTFFPHPDIVLRNLHGRYYLTTAEQRADLLIAAGVDYVVTLPFNEQVRQMRAAAFVDEMCAHLQLSSLWVGADFALGYEREGDVPFLRAQGAEKQFSVHEVDLLTAEGAAISSTAIRQALEAGQVEQARDWLGRSYALAGEVVHGEGRGRTIGYPTANIAVWEQQVIPANGIYAGWARLGSDRFMAATNVGVRPTFDGSNITVEPYLLDFDRDIYGQTLEITFEKYLRPEAKFGSLSELIAQIGRDVDEARAFLTSLPQP